MGLAQTSTPTLLAEAVPVRWRGFAVGLCYACWGIGTLLASGICYGTQTFKSMWAWRILSLLQGVPALWYCIVLLFVPESLRWLVSQGRKEEALEVLVRALCVIRMCWRSSRTLKMRLTSNGSAHLHLEEPLCIRRIANSC
jgi:MFS family permease